MYSVPLPGATAVASPLLAPAPAADMIAAVNVLANDVSTNVGGRLYTIAAAQSAVTTTSAQVEAKISLAPTLGAFLSPRGTAGGNSGIRIRAGGTYGATTTPKSVSLVIGTTSIALGPTGTTTVANMGWYAELEVRKNATSSQVVQGWGSPSMPSAPTAFFSGTTSMDETAAATVAVIGTTTAGLATDIVVSLFEVQWLP